MADIVIDGNEALHGERAIRRYTSSLIQSMQNLDSPHRYKVLYYQFRKPFHQKVEIRAKHFSQTVVPCPASLLGGLWKLGTFPKVSWLTGHLDLFHAPGEYVPRNPGVPMVITVHSMHHFRIPQYLDRGYLRSYEAFMKWCVEQGNYFITVSETMREDFVSYYGIEASKVRAIPLGVGDEFHPAASLVEVRTKIEKRFNIDRPYILYVGGIQLHKNVPRVLEAFHLLKKKKENKLLALVMTGDRRVGSDEILGEIPKLHLENDVYFTGYLNAETDDLPLLYSGAKAFVFPTLWEGWSSPPLEAMASGVPVVASDIAPHRENLGDAACLVNPENPQEIADAIDRVIHDYGYAEELRRKGGQRAGLFTWRENAENTARYYQDILQK